MLQPPAEWSVDPLADKPEKRKEDGATSDRAKDAPVAEPSTPGEGAAGGTSEAVQRTFVQGPMVFSANTVLNYRLSAIDGWFPQGRMELTVQRFEPKNQGFELEVESRFTVGWLSGNQAWKARVDEDWIQVDGKPMMPQRATPGMYWPSINGKARLIGLERVETEVATFPGCWKVLYVEDHGEPTEAWFAPGVGLVKAQFTVAGLRAEAVLTQVKI